MNILINASNLKGGGGVQVADSVCRELYKYPQHKFLVVYYKALDNCAKEIAKYDNVETLEFESHVSVITIMTGRCKFLDELVRNWKIDAVLTFFGPSLWKPQVPHLCGFARSQMVLMDSPYYKRIGVRRIIKQKIRNTINNFFFTRSSICFFTENDYISKILQAKWKGKTIYTVTNYYNQVFDHRERWQKIILPPFDGISLLTIATAYPHKNLEIAADVSRLLKFQYPDFKFRFIFSIERDEYKKSIVGIEDCFLFIGKVDITECPSLYQQCDIVFQPTLLECFTAVYPEAMRMKKPILTTDLDFAKSLCGDAAEYYSAIDAQSCADAIYNLAMDTDLQNTLIQKGTKQLEKYDNYCQRTNKLIEIIDNFG